LPVSYNSLVQELALSRDIAVTTGRVRASKSKDFRGFDGFIVRLSFTYRKLFG
jgi:hypothetical protein